ncbi:hypothetical protein KGP36_02325 [Patescibacteria group bacterium]|nr:hypothetical protein [Patescibacteria group bacterium]
MTEATITTPSARLGILARLHGAQNKLGLVDAQRRRLVAQIRALDDNAEALRAELTRASHDLAQHDAHEQYHGAD